MTKQHMPENRAGYDIKTWCGAVSISRASFYTLPANLRPRTVKLGKRHIVIEAPENYLNRMAALQANDVPQQA